MPFDHAGEWTVNANKKIELRCEISRDTANILDGKSMARGISRGELVNEILNKYAEQAVHEWIMLGRVAGLNPPAADTCGTVTDLTRAA